METFWSETQDVVASAPSGFRPGVNPDCSLAASNLHTDSGTGRLRELVFLLFTTRFDFVESSA